MSEAVTRAIENKRIGVEKEIQIQRSSQKSFEQWATTCGLVNPIADFCKKELHIMFTRYSGDYGTGFIDHILHFPLNLSCTSFYTSNFSQWRLTSDHRPLIADFNIIGGRRDQHERKIKQREYLPPIFDKNDAKLCKELSETLDKFLDKNKHPSEMSTKEMDVLLEEISTLSANTVRKYNMRRNSTYNSRKKAMKGGWSPQMRALTAQLTALIEIRRHMSGFARRRRWRGAEERKQGVKN